MPPTNKAFTQSIRFMDKINQQRIRQNKRILWPDYQVLEIVQNLYQTLGNCQQDLNLSNLFMYSTYQEKFTVRKTNSIDCVQVSEFFDQEMTHMAVWFCDTQAKIRDNWANLAESSQNSRTLENRRQKSIQKMYKTTSTKLTHQQIYVILSKRPIAIDEIVITNRKVCISVVPLSHQKFIWGGALNYEQFQASQNASKQDKSLFGNTGESFGFKIDQNRKPIPGSYRKSNGMIDKRQMRFSNHYNKNKQTVQPQPQLSSQEHVKPCSNTLRILPQHIRQHQQFLYIQLQLQNIWSDNQRNQTNFVEVQIYGRHKKPVYGGKYEDNSTSSQEEKQQGDCPQWEKSSRIKKYKRFLKDEIFQIYKMPFTTFNSYLESQLNYAKDEDFCEVNFRGLCKMFSAMKKLQLQTGRKQQKQVGNQEQNQEVEMDKIIKRKAEYVGSLGRYDFLERNKMENKLFTSKQNSQVNVKQQFLLQLNQNPQIASQQFKCINNIQVVQILSSIKSQQTPQHQTIDSIQLSIKQKIYSKLISSILQPSSSSSQLIYIPVFNPEGFQPLRIGIRKELLQALNQDIMAETTKIQVEAEKIMEKGQREQGNQNQNWKKDVQIDGPKNKLQRTVRLNKRRQTIYAGKKGQKQKSMQMQMTGDNRKRKLHKLMEVNVFLTTRVYKRQSMYLLIDLLQQLQHFCQYPSSDQIPPYLTTSLFQTYITSTQLLQSTLDLFNDLSLSHYLQPILFLELAKQLNDFTQTKMRMVQKIKDGASHIRYEAKRLSQSQQGGWKNAVEKREELERKQEGVIKMIKEYHKLGGQHTHQNCQGTLKKQYLVDLFFCFFNQNMNNDYELVRQLLSNNLSTSLPKPHGHKLQTLQKPLNSFFLLNIRQILCSKSAQLSSLISKFQSKLLQQKNERDVDTDKQEQDKQQNCPKVLWRMFKQCIKYAFQNLKDLTGNVFLGQPIEEFDQKQHNQKQNQCQCGDNSQENKDESQIKQKSQTKNKLVGHKLKTFIKRHFLQTIGFQASNCSSLLQNGTNNLYTTTITDLLPFYIKIVNIDNKIQKNQHKQIVNLMQLIQNQYPKNSFQAQMHKSDFILGQASKGLVRFGIRGKQTEECERYCRTATINQNQLASMSKWETCFLVVLNQQTEISKSIKTKQLIKKSQNNLIQLHNSKYPLLLGCSTHKKPCNIFITILQTTSLNQLTSSICIKPSLTKNISQLSSYSIDLLTQQLNLSFKNYMAKQFQHRQKHKQEQESEKLLFTCYKVKVEMDVFMRNNTKRLQAQRGNTSASTKEQQQPFDGYITRLTGSSILTFENFNSSGQTIELSQQIKDVINPTQHPVTDKISNIYKVNVRIYSKHLPVMQNYLTFLNLRLNRYMKALLTASPDVGSNIKVKDAPSKKTIGGRFTEHLNKRKSVLQIQNNMFFGSQSVKKERLFLNQKQSQKQSNRAHNKSTFFGLSQNLLYNLLRVDRSYIQDQEKILTFVDKFYEINQPEFDDYVLYLTLRPSLLRLSSVLKHYFANKIKYQESRVLKALLKTKLAKTKNEEDPLVKLFIQKPRVSSSKPLKNVKDTSEERQLLSAYMKQLSRENSLKKKADSQGTGKPRSLSSREPIFTVKQRERQQAKDVQI